MVPLQPPPPSFPCGTITNREAAPGLAFSLDVTPSWRGHQLRILHRRRTQELEHEVGQPGQPRRRNLKLEDEDFLRVLGLFPRAQKKMKPI
ncbi:hypothetical protein ATANTOWER_025899 [Ataeniobius toweri]|uniref:Uncharacterized protein n=1 Tax=Ataeniobius toweri TaxID=208326 RepID=A0ABU7BKQ4_9TELE|nr:hypothetical protein [Ataeniobius toweri]